MSVNQLSMTPKEQLLQAIETTPDSILVAVLDFLNFLKSRQRSVAEITLSDAPSDIAISPQDQDFRELAGILHRSQQKTISLEEMDQAMAKGIVDSL